MSAATLRLPDVARSKKPTTPEPDQTRDRVDLRADPEWIARVQRNADRLGLGLPAYIRMAVSKQMDRDEADQRELAGQGE